MRSATTIIMGRGASGTEDLAASPRGQQKLDRQAIDFHWQGGNNHEEDLVATLAGKEIGSISIGNGRISDITVLPDYRRQGLATLLLEEAEKEWGELEHGLLTDDGRAWLAKVYPFATFERSVDDEEYWEVRFS